MQKSIFVGNLSFDSSEDDVRRLFSDYGTVHSVNLITDRETGRPRGFGFVEMDQQEAEAAIKALDGKDISGRPLKVNLAQPKGGRGGQSRSKRRW